MSVVKILLYISWILLLPLLIIGNIFPADRLTFLSIPSNTILFFVLIFVLTLLLFSFIKNNYLTKISLLIAPFLITFLACFSLYDISLIGVEKYLNYLILGYLGAVILIISTEISEQKGIFKITIYFLALLFLAAVIWKLKFGFWERHVHYFLNGPIVFGRNMAVGFFLSLFLAKYDRKYLLFCAAFAFGVLWSMSKGPILAFLICCSIIIYLKNKRNFIIFLFFSGILGFTLLSGVIDLSDTPFKRIQLGFQVSFGYSNSTAANGSLDSRVKMVNDTLNIISGNLLTGVGSGNWGNMLHSPFTYPHNIFLEVYSELGLFLGSLLLIPCCFFLIYYKSQYYVLPLFFLISHQFSGDVADARWLLLFALFVYAEGNTMRFNLPNGK